MEKPLIDINELGRKLKIPPKTIRNKLSDGTWPLPPLRIGRALRWRPADVARELDMLAKQAITTDLPVSNSADAHEFNAARGQTARV